MKEYVGYATTARFEGQELGRSTLNGQRKSVQGGICALVLRKKCGVAWLFQSAMATFTAVQSGSDVGPALADTES